MSTDSLEKFATVIVKAHSHNDSLRVTIPSKIVKIFNIKPKDVMTWKVDGQVIIVEIGVSKHE